MEIEVKALCKSYKDADRELTVIASLTACFPSGKSIAILGASGVGKSTLLHVLGGLDRPTSGGILFGGNDIALLRGDALADFRAEHVGFIFQFHHLLPEFDALENVSMPLLIGGMAETEARSRSENMLQRVGLAERLHHRPGELSGGEQQRVAVARALVAEPAVLLADEPTGNLDRGTAAAVADLLLEIQRSREVTLIVVTHNEELADKMDLVLEMQPGGALVGL